MNKEKYLPVGSVLMLKNGKKRVMITGFVATAPETEGKVYDYIGCLYPEGVISSDKNLLFNHDQISEIYYMGYVDDEWKKVEVKLKELVEKQLNSVAKEEVVESVKENDVEVNKESIVENSGVVNNTNDLFN